MRRDFIGIAIAISICLAACTNEPEWRIPDRSMPDASADQGRELIGTFGCGGCHTIDGIPGARAKVGPPLTDFRERGSIAGTLPNTTDNLIRWIDDPQAIRPGSDMPDLGVTRDEAAHIAAYLYQQPSTWNFERLMRRGD